MKAVKKSKLFIAVLLLTSLAASCSTTGGYMPLTGNETVIGTVQTTFVTRSSLFFLGKAKQALNTEAYILLLEAAEKKYPGINIDIREIIWVTGRSVDNTNTEIAATGKVIQTN